MEEFLRHAVQALLGDVAEFSVIRRQDQEKTTYLIALPPEFAGRLIGKGGATIQALRTLVQAASKEEGKVAVELAE